MSENATAAPVTYHWVMTVQTGDGRMGTNDGRIEAIPGVHTSETTFAAVRESMRKWVDADGVTVLFYSLTPNQL